MNTTRRRFLRGAATGTAVLAIAGSAAAGWRAWDVGLIGADERPFEPWRALDNPISHRPESLVAAAILASNPHNTQPWLFDVSKDRIRIHAAPARNLGSLDPFLREMWIGLGCATENIVQAAPQIGYETRVTVNVPQGATEPVIDIALSPIEPRPARLFPAIAQRRTNRAAYHLDTFPPDVAARLTSLKKDDARVTLFSAETDAGKLFIAETLAATEMINADPDMPYDGHHWFRGTAAAMAKHRDGVAIATAGLSAFITTAGQMLPLPDATASGQFWRASTERQLYASPMFGVISVADLYSRPSQVAAGRLWQRLHLEITAAGLAAQPMNQLPEVVDRERQTNKGSGRAGQILAKLTSEAGLITFAFRVGLPTVQVPQSARRSVSEVLAS